MEQGAIRSTVVIGPERGKHVAHPKRSGSDTWAVREKACGSQISGIKLFPFCLPADSLDLGEVWCLSGRIVLSTA
jgi:hypothetical protein